MKTVKLLVFILSAIGFTVHSAMANDSLLFVQETDLPWAPAPDTLEGIVVSGKAKPSIIDWEGDGDFDVVVGDQIGLIRLYLNNASHFQEKLLVANAGGFAAPDVVDWDHDGDWDIVVGISDGRIRVFSYIEQANRYDSGPFIDAIDVGFNATPDIVDWDGDGDWDIVTGSQNNETSVYRNNADGTFTRIILLNTAYTYSAPDAVDWDGDGDLDIVDGSRQGTLTLYTNDGNGNFTTTSNFGAIALGPDTLASPETADWNSDGKRDLLIGSYRGVLSLYLQEGTDTFQKSPPGDPMSVYERSAPSVVDWDLDGDLDILSGSTESLLALFQNNGDGSFTTVSTFLDIAGGSVIVPDAVDWDNDGDWDVVTGDYSGKINLYLNESGTLQGPSLLCQTGNPNSTPDVIDWDGDGDLDILSGAQNGLTYICYNDAGVFNLSSELTYVGVGMNSAPRAGDWDHDGNLDLLIAKSTGQLSLFLYDVDHGQFIQQTAKLGNIDVGNYSVVDVVDWNQDGLRDLVIGNNAGWFYLFYQTEAPMCSPDPQENCTDGADNDCDGYVDTDDSDCVIPPEDSDGDGYSPPQDCDDTNPSVNPGSSEICDGKDNDCDGEIDEGVRSTFYYDADCDGYGDPSVTIEACMPPSRYVAIDSDCNDKDYRFHPDATEICGDGFDTDCDGDLSESESGCVDIEEGDSDYDGYTQEEGDCNDTDDTVHPGTEEVCTDKKDTNCNGLNDVADPNCISESTSSMAEEDMDHDGYSQADGDCDDADALSNPGMSENCSDGKDTNCNGLTDSEEALCASNDGYVASIPTPETDTTASTPSAPDSLDQAEEITNADSTETTEEPAPPAPETQDTASTDDENADDANTNDEQTNSDTAAPLSSGASGNSTSDSDNASQGGGGCQLVAW